MAKISPSPASLLEVAFPPLRQVRIGLIGPGKRGLKTIERYRFVEGAEIVALADASPRCTEAANALLEKSGRPHAKAFHGNEAWKKLCAERDVNLVYICTDWATHTPIALHALRAGKHVATEVPAATTLAECHALVRTAEEARRHCIMLENCCCDPFALATEQLSRDGLFGEITHCEGAYIHDLRSEFGLSAGTAVLSSVALSSSWMAETCVRHNGNPYPTHGIGPIGHLLDIHRGDRFDFLVSLTSKSPDGLRGKVNTTLIHTVRGRSILLQLDIATPRPYSRLQTVCGTRGFIQKYPLETIQIAGMSRAATGTEAVRKILEKHPHPLVLRYAGEAEKKGVPNLMNFIMDRRLVYCLRNGLPPDCDVYDAAEWSCIAELSEISANAGSRPVPVPDFTGGRWNVLPRHRYFF